MSAWHSRSSLGRQLPMWWRHGLLQGTVHQPAARDGRCLQLARLLRKQIPCGARVLRGLPSDLTQSVNICPSAGDWQGLSGFCHLEQSLMCSRRILRSAAAAPLQVQRRCEQGSAI